MRITKTYFMLMAADVPRASGFYRKAFALTPRYESPEWTELASDGATIALHKGGANAERDTGLGFDVDDIQVACASVADAGGRVVSPPEERPGEGITLATVVDTEGNRIFLSQPRRET